MKSYSSRIRWTASKRKTIANLPVRIDILDLIEPLEQPHKHVSRLGKRKLLSDADSRAPVERDVIPARLLACPALWIEGLRVLAPEVLAAVQNVRVVHDRLALLDVDGLSAVLAAAEGEGRVAHGAAAVQRDDWVQTEDFVHGVLQVLAGFERGEGDVPGVGEGAEIVDDGLAELLEHGWVTGEQEHGPAEQRRGGVAAGEEDVKKLRAEFNRVLRRGGEGMQEDVVGRFLLVSCDLLLANHFQRSLHETVHKSVHLLIRVAGLLVVHQKVQTLEPAAVSTVPLRLVKVVRELLGLGVAQSAQLSLDALSEQELSRGVDGETKEDGLDICSGGPAVVGNGQSLHGFLDMTFLQVELADLVAGELGAQESSRSGPILAVGRKLSKLVRPT